MAGSYKDIVNKDGSLKDDMVIDLMFEDGDYVVETIKEMYAMIWYLARKVERLEGYDGETYAVAEALFNYEEGKGK